MTNAIDMQLIADFQSTNLWPMIALSNIAQGSAVLAVYFLHKGNKKEEQISIPATISCYLGVTEPAMFGINLKYVYPFIAAMIGSGLAGMFSNLMGVRANAIGVGGLPGILAINFNIGGGGLAFLVAMLIAIVVPFILTIVFRRQGIFNKIDPVEEATGNLAPEFATAGVSVSNVATEEAVSATPIATTEEKLFAPVDGQVIAIGEVSDPVFSQKMMGDGFAVRPTANEIYSPVVGKVTSVFETKHAIGLLTKTGAEVLVHMGLDTVELKGAPFDVKVKEGDEVTPNTLLAIMDIAAVKAAGKGTDVLTVLTNAEKVSSLTLTKTGEIKAKEHVGEAEML